MKASWGTRFKELYTGRGALLLVILGLVVVTFTFKGSNILSLLASATSSITTAPTILYFTQYDSKTLPVGQTTNVDININAKVPVNAVGITVKYPPDLIEVVGVSKEKSFLDLWTEDTVIKEATGEVHFSGGTTMRGGLLGTSTTLTLTVEAKAPGQATLSFEDAQVFASDGAGTSLASRTHSITFTIPPVSAASALAPGSVAAPSATTPPPPVPRSADLNGDGTVNIVDVSIMFIHMLGPYDPRYDLDMDGSVGLSDLSILFSKMDSK